MRGYSTDEEQLYSRTDCEGNIQKKSGNHWGWIFLLVLVFAALIFLYYRERVQREQMEVKYDNLEVKYDNYQSKVSEAYPLIITKIEIGNMDDDGEMYDDFGEMILSWETMYLRPRITYYGLKSSSNIRLKVKLFDSDGVMRTGKTSPEGYTYDDDISIDFGHNTRVLSGWGNKNKGYYKAGSCRIEIWYEDVCLKSFKFTIY